MQKRNHRWYMEFPWYVLLFLVYPPLNLLAHNIGEVGYTAANRAILLIFFTGLFLLFLLRMVFKDWRKVGVLFTALVFLFYSYGYVLDYFASLESAISIIGRHRYMAPAWLVISILCVWGVARTRSKLEGLVSALKTIAIVLIIFPSYQLVLFAYRNQADVQALSQQPGSVEAVDAPSSSTLPDVYYIILDGYGRSDVLSRSMDYDNTLFIDQLEQQGFYVAECAQSNYAQTAISLASSLNMSYLDALGDEFTPDNKDRYRPLWDLIGANKVTEFFRQRGYKIVAFETGYHWTEFHDADVYYEPAWGGITSFESLLLRNSATLLLEHYGVFDEFLLTPEKQKRNLILYNLDQLSAVPELPGPKFVFVHLVIPHQPFVFGPNGEDLVVAPRTPNQEEYYKPEDYRIGYRNQVIYISKRIPDIMSKIIADSPSPVVIVIQGDHGPGTLSHKDRMAILNAYYFSGVRPDLYPSITPVNTFRMVFNAYFDASLELLPDDSYYSRYATPYEFQEVPNNCVVP